MILLLCRQKMSEKDAIPMKYLVTAQNRSMLRLKGRFDEQILNKISSSGFKCSYNEIHKIMNELSELGYINKRELTSEEQEKWNTLAKPLQDEILDKLDAEGLPAREVWNELLRLVKEYNA